MLNTIFYSAPLPWAYRIHLGLSVYAYLLLLPFEIVSILGWWTPLGTCICATIFLGFMELGHQ